MGEISRSSPKTTEAPSRLTTPHQGQPAHQGQPSQYKKGEPSCAKLLADPEPQQEPQMPANRPLKAHCYVNRDKQYFKDLDRTLSGIVVQTPDHIQGKISLDQIATVIASSRKVLADQLQVAIISENKFIALLPPTVDREEVVAAIPNGVWDQGYKLHTYSPLSDNAISIPMFKLWVDINGVPLELFHESHMARAVSSFGCYLGSMEPRTYGDCRTWSVFLATDDLAMVPHQLEFRIGGIVYTATVHPRKWVQGQVYHRSDLPPSPMAYQPKPSKFNVSQLALKSPSVPDPLWFQGDDVMHMSLKAMREIFRNFDPSELPPDLVECLAGNAAAIRAHNEAGRAWEQQVSRKGKEKMGTDPTPTTQGATPAHDQHDAAGDLDQHDAAGDLAHHAHCPTPSHQQGLHGVRPAAHAGPAGTEANHPTEATVHRTEPRSARGKRTLDDLALQVCTPNFLVSLGAAEHPWEPRDLFPEIGTPNHQITQTEPMDGTEDDQNPSPKQLNPPRRARRAVGSRIGKKNSGDEIVLDIDMQAFVDVPLQHAEGIELLALIGAGQTSIPQHIMLPAQQQIPTGDLGQPSKAPSKKTRHSGLDPQPAALLTAQSGDQMGPQQGQYTGHARDAHTGPLEDALGSNINEGADQDDDPYIDRVDYSDDDPLFC